MRVKLKQSKITPNLMNSLNLGVAQELGDNPYLPVSQKKITEKFTDGTGGYVDIDKVLEKMKELEYELEKAKKLLIETSIKANKALENTKTANKLSTPRMIELIGDVIGLTEFDGSSDVELAANIQRASLDTEGILKLNNTLDSSSITEAATANTVNILNTKIDNIAEKIDFIPELPENISKNAKYCLCYDDETKKMYWVNISDSLGYGI